MTTAVDPLLAQASELTGGLADFGDDSFRDGLEVFLDSGANEGQLTEIGKAARINVASTTIVGERPGYMVIPDLINPQGKIVFNAKSYTVYDNEMDALPSKSHQPYPHARCLDEGLKLC